MGCDRFVPDPGVCGVPKEVACNYRPYKELSLQRISPTSPKKEKKYLYRGNRKTFLPQSRSVKQSRNFEMKRQESEIKLMQVDLRQAAPAPPGSAVKS